MHKRIRVLSVIDGLAFGGDETRLLSMGRFVDPGRFHHSVLTLDPGSYSARYEFEARRKQYIDAGLQVDDFARCSPEQQSTGALSSRLSRKTAVLRRARRLAGLVRQWNVDVIDAHLGAAGFVGAIAGKWTGRPVAITHYGGYTSDFQVRWPWTERLAFQLAQSVITDSDIRARQIRSLLKSGRGKVLLIRNGIPRPQSKRSNAEMRRLLRLPEDRRVRIVGQVGSLYEYKGHEVLIRAARKVSDRESNVAFLCVGYVRNQSHKDHLLSLARELGIADRVHFREYGGDIADIWTVIDVHAHASLFDSLPISIAEGMSLAKPAAVTSTGGITEMVLHGETGLVVQPGDADALSEAILVLLQRPELGESLGRRAQERYERLYKPEAMARAFEEHFSRLATGGHDRALSAAS